MDLEQRGAGGLPQGRESVGELIGRITDDLKTIARDEVVLARGEVKESLKAAGADAAAAILGGIVALIGFAMLCSTAIVALEPLIEPLWLRMLIMSVIYLVVGGAVAGAFAKRLKSDLPPRADRAEAQAKRTMRTLKEGVQHG